jgi:hypothetical protein
LRAADIAAVVEFSLRAWAPVFEAFRTVLGERIYQALYPDWTTSQARAVEAVCQDNTAKVWVAERHGRPVGYVCHAGRRRPIPASSGQVARRTAEGNSPREVRRCLARAVAR